ncbi:MAG: PA2779 family protein [Pseudomonadales bacterium]|jgi:hypothetical protein|nr:PA2779 family protein [Pseudomonadales bacterium]
MTISKLLRGLLTVALCGQLVFLGVAAAPAAHAGAFATRDYLEGESRLARIDRVQAFLAEERVQAQLEQLGVSPEHAAERVAALSDAELARLDGQLQSLPAGGNIVGLVGAVFVVLLILELLGVTNVFTAI